MSRSSPSERPTLLRKASLRDIIDAQTVQRDAEALRNAPWYILRPTSTFMSVWDGVTSTALIFTAVVTPFEVSFLEPAETMLDGLWLINRLVDAIFVVDMALQFFLMYQVGRDDGAGTSWEYRLPQIQRHYLRGWFTLDALSIFPSVFDILPYTGAMDAGGDLIQIKIVRIIRTTRLLKLVRLVRSSRLVKRWRTRISLTLATISIFLLALYIVVATHWLACLLALQTIFVINRRDSWFGSFGWCTLDDDEEEVCVSTGQQYVASLHWAFGIISGYFNEPGEGPYPPHERIDADAGGKKFSTEEQLVNLFLVVFGALGWAYVTAKIVEIIVNYDPDATAFKNRIDHLNRFISFYELKPDVARQCREYFYETRYSKAAEARRAIIGEMSSDLQELVSDVCYSQWLTTVPFFRGMRTPDGVQIVEPAERAFLAKVAVLLQSEVYVPRERPPIGRLYMIYKGSCRLRGTVRSNGFSWGALEVMLPNAPIPGVEKRAIATTYLHCLWIDGPTIRACAEGFPKTQLALRKWTLFNGLREYMFDQLRKASDADRKAARQWVESRKARPLDLLRKVGRKAILLSKLTGGKAGAKAERTATTIGDLHRALDKRFAELYTNFGKRFDAVGAAVSAVEERQARAAARVDELAKAMRTGEPPAAADPVPVVKQKSKRRPSHARPRAAPLDAATADPMEC